MGLSKNIIQLNKKSHKDFNYYDTIISKIENNTYINPDISIESCKSLLEGISKTIIQRLELTITPAKLKEMTFQELHKNACWSLQKRSDFEIKVVQSSTGLIQRIAEIRNERGDISHGKSAPKENTSTKETAIMIIHLTDAIVNYMLSSFYKIDLTYGEKLNYEDNPDFNAMLDEEKIMLGVLYSKALFDQDIVTYEEELSSFNELIKE